MKEKLLLDISEVCEILGITSRTLRFYEDKGLISSTREFSKRRKYSTEQIELVKKILVLRTLGLNIAKIKEIQAGDSDLRQAIIEHKSQIIATIVSKSKEIRLLDEALDTLEHDGNIYKSYSDEDVFVIENEIVNIATDNFILGNYDVVFDKFSEKLQAYTPLSSFKRIVADTLTPLGSFLSLENVIRDKIEKHIYYSHLRFEKLGLRIKFVMYEDKIHGFWLSYYEL